MNMDWWKPYFYINMENIQILFEYWRIQSTFDAFICFFFIFFICLLHQYIEYII